MCPWGRGGREYREYREYREFREFRDLVNYESWECGQTLSMVNIVCYKVLSGSVCCSGRRMDLIPRAEHRVRRTRLSMKLAHLGRGGNYHGYDQLLRAALYSVLEVQSALSRVPSGVPSV